ncbi:hypothetical protein I2F29_11850 [Acinetobacter sp. FNA3]|uniref:HEPN domain-containing protein n=2 Tax=Acinetobacter pollinis TaxID=2605270 RepID=A0ABU6DSN0_9GAMM|nr:hypothetical protein [Acinetobacter pollinis]MBF7694091.1 hypothetical protein [Acinetobacter pollinis]MBF7699898.1 hypothetical protein [Acinetobacter pollinis]MEB5476849.1 hypothetical protein [Acinetobacter pollinis]
MGHMKQQLSQGTEALRAMVTLRQCWLENEEIYINKGCLHCGSAATYLIYFTNKNIQKIMLDFISRYNCNHSGRFDLLDLNHFEKEYEQFLSSIEQEIIHYAFKEQNTPRKYAFESIESIFERELNMAC